MGGQDVARDGSKQFIQTVFKDEPPRSRSHNVSDDYDSRDRHDTKQHASSSAGYDNASPPNGGRRGRDSGAQRDARRSNRDESENATQRDARRSDNERGENSHQATARPKRRTRRHDGDRRGSGRIMMNNRMVIRMMSSPLARLLQEKNALMIRECKKKKWESVSVSTQSLIPMFPNLGLMMMRSLIVGTRQAMVKGHLEKIFLKTPTPLIVETPQLPEASRHAGRIQAG
jgi:hypothetical protein